MNDLTAAQILEMSPEEQNEHFANEFDELIGLKPKAEKTLESEVDKLLERNGISREEASTPETEPHPFDEIGKTQKAAEPLPVITPDIEMIEESMLSASANAAGAAVAANNKLIPEFGHVLERRGPTGLAHAFPPPVQALITKTKLTPEQTDHLLSQFSNLFVLSSQMRARVETIEIRGAEDEAAIAEAKECHKILRDERLNAEKRKKIIKEPYLRPSQLIDGVFKIWMDEIGPLEKLAKEKAEYVENLEKERKAALAKERLEKLRLFEADGGSFDLGEIDDAAFELIYQGAITSYNAKKAEAARIEQERLEKERQDAAERERLRAENERLAKERAEAEAREREAQARADEERRIREEAERELKRKEEERLAEQRRIEAEAEAKRLAPDKDKLLSFISEIEAVFVPEISEAKAVAVSSTIVLERAKFCDRMKEMVAGLK